MDDPIAARLRAERIDALYHFTSVENLPGIAGQQALCSKKYLADHAQWPCPEPGGNELSQNLDAHHGNTAFVELFFTPHNPMAYWRKRQRHICWLVIEPSVASGPGVVFTNRNAAATGHLTGSGLEGVGLVNFAAVRAIPRPGDRSGWVEPVQAEVMVPERVPLTIVRSIAFISQASLEDSERRWGAAAHPPFVVRPDLFGDVPGGGPEAISFPFLKKALLTDEVITRASANLPRPHRNRFAPATTGEIFAVAGIRSYPGSTVSFDWCKSGPSNTLSFDRQGDFTSWHPEARSGLSVGSHHVTIQVNGVRWSTMPFEVVE